MFSYSAYGLHIRSEIMLPELAPGAGAVDVVVRFGPIDAAARPEQGNGDVLRFRSLPGAFCLVHDEIGAFLARDGREIVVDPLPDVPEQVLRLFILGGALGAILRQRGFLVLHASAVALDGAAVAFLGFSGWGKSTMAAALHARGCELVADDVVAVADGGDGPIVYPGFPQLKLWPEVAVSLGADPSSLPRLHPQLEKRARRLTTGFAQAALPLRGLYILGESPTIQIAQLAPQDALIELLRHSYGARSLHPEGAPEQFMRLADLRSKLWVRALLRPKVIEQLPELANLILADLRRDDVQKAVSSYGRTATQ